MSNSGNNRDERFIDATTAAASAAPAVLPAIVKHFSYPFKVRENIEALKSAVERLEAMEGGALAVREQNAGNPGFPAERTVNMWLNQANKVKNEARNILDQFRQRVRLFHKFWQDYGISKNAEKKLAIVKDLCSNPIINELIIINSQASIPPQAQASTPPPRPSGIEVTVETSRSEYGISVHRKKK